jgi:hypothetical protein
MKTGVSSEGIGVLDGEGREFDAEAQRRRGAERGMDGEMRGFGNGFFYG